MPIDIVTQEEEGILGFITSVSRANADPNTTVSWDIGAGSFQIAAKEGEQYYVHEGKMGSVPVKTALLDTQGKAYESALSPNPVTPHQAEMVIQKIREDVSKVPDELRQKIHHPNTVVLATGIHPLWWVHRVNHYDKETVHKILQERLYLDDDAIDAKDSIIARGGKKWQLASIVSNLILTYGVMEGLGIHQVNYDGTVAGNATGLLLSPQYWEKSECRMRNAEDFTTELTENTEGE